MEQTGKKEKPAAMGNVECCPSLEPCAVCDILNFNYKLPFRPVAVAGDRKQTVPVEVTLHFRLTRCSGALALGDLIYSNTLLPGETVRLFSSDRHTRFTFDSSSELAYRHETTSEESLHSAGMAYAMSNLSLLDTTRANSSYNSSSVGGGVSGGIDLGIFSIGGSVSASSYDANSTSTLARQLTEHAESSQQHVEVSTRAASSTSIGEVATRTHQQSESEDQYESSSRSFSNPNHCHALTFLFYRINKCQTVRFELVSIDRRVDDPAMPTGVLLNPPVPPTNVPVLTTAVHATATDRLDVAVRARSSAIAERAGTTTDSNSLGRAISLSTGQEPIPVDLRKAALKQVDQDLVEEGLIDKAGRVSQEAIKKFSWERTFPLPTPGVMVKGCLDTCDVCEPELQKKMELEMVHQDLENQLLKKQIDLLEKSREYRCCADEQPVAP
ncbi:MAG TPA: hypothetical protein VH088_19830 [Terriglobales bacterium]|jgi:hypothetical protein|nr:hypothetical protein [Terriglobales bacterium]